MSPLLARLGREHRRLTQVLDLLESLLDRFNLGDEPDYELMSELLEYVIDYADQVHHPSEDLIFARMHAYSSTQFPVIERLMHQHASLGQLNRRFRESLEGIVHEEVLRRDEVEQQGRELIAAHRDHLRTEDQEAFPIALSVLSEQDWAELEGQAPTAEDPVFGQADPARFQALFGRLKRDAGDEPGG